MNIELLFIKVLAAMPLFVSRAFGVAIGWLLAILPVKISRPKFNAAINIAQCFPEQSKQWRARLVRQNLIETGKTISEFPHTWTRDSHTQLKRFHTIHQEELFLQALDMNKGLLLLAPHIANWEILGHYLASKTPVTIMYRRSKNPALDEFVIRARNRGGMKLAHTDMGGIRTCLKALKKGEVVAILPDHAPNSRNNPYAPFFGIPALTTSFISQLYHKVNPAILAVYSHRLPNNKYDVYFQSVHEKLFEDDELASATGLNATVEKCLMNYPEQYNWSYKRFARRPGKQPRFYQQDNLVAGNYQQYLNDDSSIENPLA